MRAKQPDQVGYQVLELGGERYAVVRESCLLELCRRADIEPAGSPVGDGNQVAGLAEMDLDREALAQRLVLRRRRAGLTQAELARRAGIRGETLNRVERGHTTPDFSTIRKLIIAINLVEAELNDVSTGGPQDRKEV